MKRLEAALKKMGVNYGSAQIDMLEDYMKYLLIKNRNINLTGIKEREEFISKHYIDSLLVSTVDEFKEAKTVIDVGTGGGFPGIPLAIFFPEKEFLLVDSLAKRLNAVLEIAKKVGINNVSVAHGRAEDLGKKEEYREKFDFCVSRAVAPLATLSESCIPFIKVGGSFIAYKTAKASEEIEDAKKAILLLGGNLQNEITEFVITTKLHHSLVVIKKSRMTPLKYPRKAGTPSRNPISQKDVSRETLRKKALKIKG